MLKPIKHKFTKIDHFKYKNKYGRQGNSLKSDGLQFMPPTPSKILLPKQFYGEFDKTLFLPFIANFQYNHNNVNQKKCVQIKHYQKFVSHNCEPTFY